MTISHIRMTPLERRMGRLMRAPDHPSDGGSMQLPAQAAGNSTGTEASPATPANNGGQEFDAASFWQSPAAEPASPSTQGNAGVVDSAAGTAQKATELGQWMTQQVQALTAGNVFSDQVAAQINDGDYSGVNDAMSAALRGSVQTTMALVAKLLPAYKEQMANEFRAMMDERFGSRDNSQVLETEFPELYANPATRGMVQNVFAKSLEHSKGDRTEAAKLTQTMLKLMSSQFATAPSLGNPPSSAADGVNAGATSLLDELLGK